MTDSKREILTREYVESLLMYCPCSGNFVWKKRGRSMFGSQRAYRTWNSRYAMKTAGTKMYIHGYIRIQINKKIHYGHRLAWLLVYGKHPDYEIDHKNGNTEDNRIGNLRDIPHSENQKNLKLRKDSKSGHLGVFYYGKEKKWRAEITVDGKYFYLGRYGTLEGAVAARLKAEAENGFHENHGKRA